MCMRNKPLPELGTVLGRPSSFPTEMPGRLCGGKLRRDFDLRDFEHGGDSFVKNLSCRGVNQRRDVVFIHCVQPRFYLIVSHCVV